MGRQREPHVPTETSRAVVKELAGFGIPQKQIAKRLEITDETLSKYYREELDWGMAEVKERVVKFLVTAATGEALSHPVFKKTARFADSVKAATFYAQTQMGYSIKQEIDHTSSDKSLAVNVYFDQPAPSQQVPPSDA